ncbi:MAG TPA: YihY/virulence factor BrkB family protein [Acidimicrobiales bacterium]|nr:YihY/virulence factor BrkB family protein [Acidimicrobiales bacterium]
MAVVFGRTEPGDPHPVATERAEPEPADGSARPSAGRGAGPGWREILSALKTRIRRDRVSVSAGSLAFHGFLAFFPAIIAALGVLTLVHAGQGTLHQLTDAIARALPAGTAEVFQSAVRAATKRHEGSVTAVVVGVVVALWSATSATAVLQQVLDVAYGVPLDRKFMVRRVRGLPLLVLTGMLGSLAAALVVFGEPIESAIRSSVPLGAAFTVAWTVARWVVAFAAISVLFSTYYWVAPNRQRVRWRWVTPGSLLAATVFLLGSLGFSFYISTFGSYSKTYGTFAGAAIFVFWLYLTSLAVLIGGELNAELERVGMLRALPARRGAPGRSGPDVPDVPGVADVADVPGRGQPAPDPQRPSVEPGGET